METETVNINHKFSDPERLALAEEQSRLLSKQDSLDAKLKCATTQIKAEIAECIERIRVVSTKLLNKHEFKDVECLILDHRRDGERHVVRMDTGHVVKVRKLRADERQIKLPGVNGEPQKDYVAIAYCQVDDNAVEADVVELRVYDDEFEVLRKCPDVILRDVPRMVESATPEKKEQPNGAVRVAAAAAGAVVDAEFPDPEVDKPPSLGATYKAAFDTPQSLKREVTKRAKKKGK